MWTAPLELFLFSEWKFDEEKDCVEYVLEELPQLISFLEDIYERPDGQQPRLYCIDGEEIKNVLEKEKRETI